MYISLALLPTAVTAEEDPSGRSEAELKRRHDNKVPDVSSKKPTALFIGLVGWLGFFVCKLS